MRLMYAGDWCRWWCWWWWVAAQNSEFIMSSISVAFIYIYDSRLSPNETVRLTSILHKLHIQSNWIVFGCCCRSDSSVIRSSLSILAFNRCAHNLRTLFDGIQVILATWKSILIYYFILLFQLSSVSMALPLTEESIFYIRDYARKWIEMKLISMEYSDEIHHQCKQWMWRPFEWVNRNSTHIHSVRVLHFQWHRCNHDTAHSHINKLSRE